MSREIISPVKLHKTVCRNIFSIDSCWSIEVMHCGIKEIKLNEYDSFFFIVHVLCISKSVLNFCINLYNLHA